MPNVSRNQVEHIVADSHAVKALELPPGNPTPAKLDQHSATLERPHDVQQVTEKVAIAADDAEAAERRFAREATLSRPVES